MLEIGKTQDVFRVAKKGVSAILTAKTKDDFKKAKVDIKKCYATHMKANKATLNNFQLRIELIHNPRKYNALPD